MQQKQYNKTSAFTLIEVIIFVAISSIILITLVSLSISVMRSAITSQHKLYATRHADELAEWLRLQKEISWQDFYNKSQTIPGRFCVNEDILLTSTLTSNLLAMTDCALYDGVRAPNLGPKIFKRSVEFPTQPDNTKSVRGIITVEWLEPGNSLNIVKVETLFAPR